MGDIRVWEGSVIGGQVLVLVFCIGVDSRNVYALRLLVMAQDIVISSAFLVGLRLDLHDQSGDANPASVEEKYACILSITLLVITEKEALSFGYRYTVVYDLIEQRLPHPVSFPYDGDTDVLCVLELVEIYFTYSIKYELLSMFQKDGA